MEVLIQKPTNKDKKFMLETHGQIFHFGAAGYEDYTMHNDDDRKPRYIKRHMKNEKWDNPTKAGFYSRWVLWHKKTIEESIADINKRFNLNVKM